MAKTSRTKGAAGEREWAKVLNTHHGLPYYRRAARIGLASADVDLTPLGQSWAPNAPVYEVKRRAVLPDYLTRGMEQALDVGGHLVFRQDLGLWWVAMPATEYLSMMDALKWDTKNWRKG